VLGFWGTLPKVAWILCNHSIFWGFAWCLPKKHTNHQLRADVLTCSDAQMEWEPREGYFDWIPLQLVRGACTDFQGSSHFRWFLELTMHFALWKSCFVLSIDILQFYLRNYLAPEWLFVLRLDLHFLSFPWNSNEFYRFVHPCFAGHSGSGIQHWVKGQSAGNTLIWLQIPRKCSVPSKLKNIK
jgi:hypothetical protein